MEFEDDVFFADLSKQIALLIMDDEEFPLKDPTLPIQEFPYMSQSMFPQIAYNGYQEIPYRRESKGTGVFIPRSTINPKRKNIKSSGISNSFVVNKKNNNKTLKKISSNNSRENCNNDHVHSNNQTIAQVHSISKLSREHNP